jgi:hypothetical protein
MRTSRPHLLTLMATLTLAPALHAQGPPMPKPGPEHELFKNDAGTWDATVQT